MPGKRWPRLARSGGQLLAGCVPPCARSSRVRCPVLVARAVLLPAVLVLLCWFFAINEIAACACLALLRGRFGIERPRTKSSASPGQPLARQAIAAPGAFWRPRFGRGLHTPAKNCAHIFPRRHQAATLAPKPKGPVCRNAKSKRLQPPPESGALSCPNCWGWCVCTACMVLGGMGRTVTPPARLRACYEHPAHLSLCRSGAVDSLDSLEGIRP